MKEIILEVYCLTGCDTTSFLYFQGKKTPFKILEEKAENHKDLHGLGIVETLTAVELCAATKFVGEIYGKQNCTLLNSLRVHKAKLMVSTKHMPQQMTAVHINSMYYVVSINLWIGKEPSCSR